MKKTITVLTACLFLTACDSLKSATMEQRLEGKLGSDRHNELYHICLQHANGPILGGGYYPGHDFRRERLCHQMNDLNEPTNGNPHSSSEDQKRFALASECTIEIVKGLVRDNPLNVKQHKTFQRICEGMTGTSVDVAY